MSEVSDWLHHSTPGLLLLCLLAIGLLLFLIIKIKLEPFISLRIRSAWDEVGVVQVWRSTSDNAVQHAALSLGGGWMLHKPSQSWMTPRKVLTTAQVKRSTRTAGWTLSRHQLS